ALFRQFQSDPHAIVRWATHAAPRDFASLAPAIIEHADDPVATELLRFAAGHVDRLAARLVASGVQRIAPTGGLRPFIAPPLSEQTRRVVVAPQGDALDGALRLARTAAGMRAGQTAA